MLSFLLPALASLAVVQSKSVELCSANQCLEGATNITNFGATLSTSDTDFILLPGTYTPSVSDSTLQKALTSSSSTVSIGNGFTNNTAATAPAPPSLPLSLALQPGVLSYPTDGFVGKPTFISQPTSPSSFNGTALSLGSFLIPPSTWVAIEATTGSSTSRFVIWDNFPFRSQLPPSLALASSISVKDIQTSTCSPTCSSKAICSTQGKCVCPTGFSGASCETCQAGFFGPNCSKCPSNCDKCDEGPSGTGACLSTPLPSDAPSKCNCLNGSCGSSSTCTCIAGWTNASNGTACAACDKGFFLDSSSGNCLSCDSGCSACSATACTTCAPGTVQHPTIPTKCIPSGSTTCGAGTFQSGTSCLVCNSLCASCTGPNSTDCTSCPSNAALRGGQCLIFDNTGVCQGTALVVDKRKNVCDTCPPKCAKCSIPNFNPNAATQDQRQCDQCLPGFALDNGNCVATCPAGKVVSSDGKTCTACTNGCTTCVGSPSFCLTCSSGQSAFNGQCVSSCPTNTFSSNGSCISCHPDCASCSGPAFNQCKTCPSNLPVLAGTGRCLPTCSKTEYFDASSGTCKSCDSSCGSCSTGGSSGCLSCASDKTVLRAGKCEPVDCGTGSGTVGGLGVCLAELVLVPNNAAIPPVSIPPLDPNVATNAQQGSGGYKPEWWHILLMVLGGLFIIALCILIWRRQARKKRAKRTQEFKAKLEHRGFWSRLWRNPFSFFSRRKRDNRTRDLEGARSSAGDWRTSASRTDEDRRTWITMQESAPRRPSITGRTTSDRYTYDSRAGRSEGRSQRTKGRPQYLGVPGRSQYGESQYAKEIEEEDEYRSERSYSYRAPSPRRDREPRRQPSYTREQERIYADLNDQVSRGNSPSVYSQVTGQPRRRPEHKERTRDLLTSHYSASTDGESLAASKALRKPAPQVPMPDFDMQSLQEVKRYEPEQRSDAELYKLSTMFPELKNQSPDHSSSGRTAIDRNPFRKPSY